MDRRPDYDAEDALALLGERLNQWRRTSGLTQTQVADRAGVSRATVIRLEAGEAGPSVEMLVRVLGALHLTEKVTGALDPLRSAVGAARAQETLPLRIRRR